jgi:hypothetical protein
MRPRQGRGLRTRCKICSTGLSAFAEARLLRVILLYTARPEPVDQPPRFALRRSAVALAKAEGRAAKQRSWFDRLTMSVYSDIALTTLVAAEALAEPCQRFGRP